MMTPQRAMADRYMPKYQWTGAYEEEIRKLKKLLSKELAKRK